MKLEYKGEELIPVGHDKVWSFVTDPDRVGRCLPDVVEVTVHDPTHLDAIVKVGVGPVKGKFKFKIELQPAATQRRIDLKISGGGLGSAVDLTAGADLIDADNGATRLAWGGEAVARGSVAAVGGRVLDAQAQKLITQTFANVREQLTA